MRPPTLAAGKCCFAHLSMPPCAAHAAAACTAPYRPHIAPYVRLHPPRATRPSELLLSRGANPFVANSVGRTALDEAVLAPAPAIVRAFQQKALWSGQVAVKVGGRVPVSGAVSGSKGCGSLKSEESGCRWWHKERGCACDRESCTHMTGRVAPGLQGFGPKRAPTTTTHTT